MRLPDKNYFIRDYILPVLEPVEVFFGKYGVHKITVTAIPVLIIVLLLIKGELNSKKKSASALIVYFFVIIVILLAILKYQFFNNG